MGKEQREALKDWLTMLAIAAGAAWALWTFVFAEVLKPNSLQSFMQVVIELRVAGAPVTVGASNMLPILVKVTARNASAKKVRVASGYLDVDATTITPAGSVVTNEKLEQVLDDRQSSLDPFSGRSAYERAFISTVFNQSSFDVGEQQYLERMFWIPEGVFHQLEANAYLISSQEDPPLELTHRLNDQGAITYLEQVANAWVPLKTTNGIQRLPKGATFARSTAYLALSSPTPPAP